MKTVISFLFLLVSLISTREVAAQDSCHYSAEVASYSGLGLMSDPSGNGFYQYTQAGVNFVKGNHLIGPFVQMVLVDVTFGGYRYQAWEEMIGVSYYNWGSLSKEYDYTVGVNATFKHFDDKGKASGASLEEKQKDYGFYGYVAVNFDNINNYLFSSYKAAIYYQNNFWSDRTGFNLGNIADKVNVKAVNKMYVKGIFESSVKKIFLGSQARIEPKVVFGYLYDGGSQKNMYEFGIGFALSFVKNQRYYEPVNIQYRARYGVDFKNKLDLVEINSDLISLFKLIF